MFELLFQLMLHDSLHFLHMAAILLLFQHKQRVNMQSLFPERPQADAVDVFQFDESP